MPRYALLLKANASRVFGESAFGLAQAELATFDQRVLHGIVTHQERATIGGVDYLVVDTTAPVDAARLAVLSNLSSLHAVFEVDDDGRFRPARFAPRKLLAEDIVTIQRYAGKTNEAFTHLLLNVALAASGDAFERLLAGERVRLLDPACGRGTSLNRAALYGMDACGIEVDQRDVEAYDLFFTTWLKDKRMKHAVERATLRKGRATPAHRVTITYGAGKDPRTHRVVDVVHDDTAAARDPRTASTVRSRATWYWRSAPRPDWLWYRPAWALCASPSAKFARKSPQRQLSHLPSGTHQGGSARGHRRRT